MDIVQPKKCLTASQASLSDFGPRTISCLDLRVTKPDLVNKMVDERKKIKARPNRDSLQSYFIDSKKIDAKIIDDSKRVANISAEKFDKQCPLVNENVVQNRFSLNVNSSETAQNSDVTSGLELNLTYGFSKSNCQTQQQVQSYLNNKAESNQAKKHSKNTIEKYCRIQKDPVFNENKQIDNCQAQNKQGGKNVTQSESSVYNQSIPIQSQTSELDTVLHKIKSKNISKINKNISPKKSKTPSKSRKNIICSENILKSSPKSHSVKKKNKSIVQSLIRDFEARNVPPISSSHRKQKDIKCRRSRVKNESEVSRNQSKITTFFGKEN